MTRHSMFALLMVVLLSAPQAYGQVTSVADSIKEISLQEALLLTEKENFQIRIAQTEIDEVRSQYRQTNASFLPQLSIEETGISTNNPLNVFGSKLKQEVVTQADFNPAVLNAPDPYENFTTSFQVRQPVLNADMLFKRSAVKSQMNAAKEQLEGTIQYARYQVKDTYYQLLLMQSQLDVMDKSLQTARENRRQAKDFYDQQMISKADYLAAKVRVLELESQRSRLENQRQTIEDNLGFLLNLDQDVRIVPTDSMQVTPLPTDSLPTEGVSNSKILAMQHRVDAARKMLRSAKFSFVPSLNLFGNYELNDDVLFGSQGESYMIGATLRWNLFSGFSKVGKVMESRASLKKAELAYESTVYQNKIEVQQAKRALDQAQQQLEYASSSVEQAREDLRIRSNRYEQGMEKTTDLLATETKLAQARMQRLNAIYQYNNSLATLELLLEHNLTY